jgi:hypothetical protein
MHPAAQYTVSSLLELPAKVPDLWPVTAEKSNRDAWVV